MRRFACLAALATLAACGGGVAPQNEQAPPRVPAKATPPPPATNAIAGGAPDPAAVAGLSPSQRRAYQRGFADCRAGRYDPDRYPEAYRIGCAAAHDR
jgi:hypothetical protein